MIRMSPSRDTEEKRRIVNEAYNTPNNIRPTARKYNVQPMQIRRWKKQLDQVGSNPAGLPKKNHDRILKPQMYNHLLAYYENLRSEGRPVTIQSLVREWKRQIRRDASFNQNVSDNDLEKRISRWLKRERITRRRATRVAQRTRWNQLELASWVRYINRKLLIYSFDPHMIVNIDETYLPFDVTSKYTLDPIGTRTVRIISSGSSSRCTLVLAVSFQVTYFSQLSYSRGSLVVESRESWWRKTDTDFVFWFILQFKIARGWMNVSSRNGSIVYGFLILKTTPLALF